MGLGLGLGLGLESAYGVHMVAGPLAAAVGAYVTGRVPLLE